MDRQADQDLTRSAEPFAVALDRLEQAPAFDKLNHIGQALDTADCSLRRGNVAAVYELAPGFDQAGVFSESDWDYPDCLQPGFVPTTLAKGDCWTVTLECLSLLRLLAIAEGKYVRSGFSAEQAGYYLREVLALSLEYVFDRQSEAARVQADQSAAVRAVMQFLAETVGYENLLDELVDEIWRLLRQRPVQVGAIQVMVTKLAGYCYSSEHEITTIPVGAERLISSLYSPSPASREDPGLGVYAERLSAMDANRLQEEANAVARSMHDTGLVSPYHAVLLRHLAVNAPETISTALGLSTTGLDGLLTYRELVHALIDKAVHLETCQCIYGLAALLERAALHFPGLASSLWRQIKLYR